MSRCMGRGGRPATKTAVRGEVWDLGCRYLSSPIGVGSFETYRRRLVGASSDWSQRRGCLWTTLTTLTALTTLLAQGGKRLGPWDTT
eukprot:364550-Chlamydomonas_euryale.AAC.15